MAEEVSMFERIINRIAERSEANRLLRANDEAFKTKLSGALGDAAPDDATDAAGFVAGVESLWLQLAGARKQTQDDTNRIAELTKQRETAYDAERAATKRADDLQAEQQLIAEKLGLLETEDEPVDAVDADPNEAGDTAVDAAADDSDDDIRWSTSAGRRPARLRPMTRRRHEYPAAPRNHRHQLGNRLHCPIRAA